VTLDCVTGFGRERERLRRPGEQYWPEHPAGAYAVLGDRVGLLAAAGSPRPAVSPRRLLDGLPARQESRAVGEAVSRELRDCGSCVRPWRGLLAPSRDTRPLGSPEAAVSSLDHGPVRFRIVLGEHTDHCDLYRPHRALQRNSPAGRPHSPETGASVRVLRQDRPSPAAISRSNRKEMSRPSRARTRSPTVSASSLA
jgi:hypothetical protein